MKNVEQHEVRQARRSERQFITVAGRHADPLCLPDEIAKWACESTGGSVSTGYDMGRDL
jgi:hypothetical protein